MITLIAWSLLFIALLGMNGLRINIRKATTPRDAFALVASTLLAAWFTFSGIYLLGV